MPADERVPPGSTAPLSDLPEPVAADAPLPEVPGYVVEALLGRGSMGSVYRATEISTARAVALKWLPASDAGADRARERFQREARAAAAIRHPNVVLVFGAGSAPTGDYIAMELIDGFPLSNALESGHLGKKAFTRLLAKVARGLAAAHELALIHRDVKPSNILVDQDLEPHLADFGLARFVAEASDLTGPQAILGTYAYMAPEVAAGGAQDATPAADVFSLGCVLFEGFAGKPPFLAPTVRDLIVKLGLGEVPPLPEGTPAAIDRLCREALAREPGGRPTALAFAERLEQAFEPAPAAPSPPPAAPPSTVAASAKPAPSRRGLLVLAPLLLAAVAAAAYVADTLRAKPPEGGPAPPTAPSAPPAAPSVPPVAPSVPPVAPSPPAAPSAPPSPPEVAPVAGSWRHRMRLALERQDLDEEDRLVEEALEHETKLEAQGGLHHRHACVALLRGDTAAARSELDSVLVAHPYHVGSLAVASGVALASGDADRAEKLRARLEERKKRVDAKASPFIDCTAALFAIASGAETPDSAAPVFVAAAAKENATYEEGGELLDPAVFKKLAELVLARKTVH
jgi:serine/threonine-protein kinase